MEQGTMKLYLYFYRKPRKKGRPWNERTGSVVAPDYDRARLLVGNQFCVATEKVTLVFLRDTSDFTEEGIIA